MAAPEQQAGSRQVTAGDGARLHVAVLDRTGSGGAAPAVVLAGGPARDPGYLGDLAGLDEVRPLAVIHQRGVPPSDAGADRWRRGWWQQADDVEAVRSALGCDRVDLVAHSAGARVALAYAAQHRERVASLTLVTPSAGFLVDEPSDAAQLLDQVTTRRAGEAELATAARALGDGPPAGGDDAALHDWQRAVAPLGYARWDETARGHAAAARWHLPAFADFLAWPAPDGFAASLAVLPVPVLVVAGADDCLTGVSQPRALARLLPRGSLAVLADCGHFPWVEQPAAFRQAVTGFLRADD